MTRIKIGNTVKNVVLIVIVYLALSMWFILLNRLLVVTGLSQGVNILHKVWQRMTGLHHLWIVVIALFMLLSVVVTLVRLDTDVYLRVTIPLLSSVCIPAIALAVVISAYVEGIGVNTWVVIIVGAISNILTGYIIYKKTHYVDE